MAELLQNVTLVDILQIIISLVLSLLLFKKTGDKKYLEDFMKNYVLNTPTKALNTETPGQTFSNLKPVYRLNQATNTLERTEEVIDIQEVIESCKNETLNAVLERFFPQDAISENVIAVNTMQDDLDVMTEIVNKANYYKSKFNLDPAMSVQDVFAVVEAKSAELKTKIKEMEAKNSEKEKETL